MLFTYHFSVYKKLFIIRVTIVFSLIRSAFELFYIEDLNPLDLMKGHNRYKLWVGTMLFTCQFVLKLLATNVIFDGSLRNYIIYCSIFNLSYNVMRLQNNMKYSPFGADLEYIYKLLAFGGLLTANFMVILNTMK